MFLLHVFYLLLHCFHNGSQYSENPVNIVLERIELFVIEVAVVVKEVEPVVGLVCFLEGDTHLTQKVGIALGVLALSDVDCVFLLLARHNPNKLGSALTASKVQEL